MVNKDMNSIDLSVPLLPEMIKVVRLSASCIASNMGFKVDDIEDIKVVISEVFNILIKKLDKGSHKIKIEFYIYEDKLSINLYFVNGRPKKFMLFSDEEDGIAFAIFNALVDNAEFSNEGDKIISLDIYIKEI
jgi:serine/threonine-protein kinase RsbW